MVKCPTCQKEQVYRLDNPSRPFCCERCRLIDLGAWAAENHVISGQLFAATDVIDEFSLPDELLEQII